MSDAEKIEELKMYILENKNKVTHESTWHSFITWLIDEFNYDLKEEDPFDDENVCYDKGCIDRQSFKRG